jgi:hypothetical protein
MARKINKSLKIRKYVLRHPNASYSQVADACGVPTKYVYQIMYNARKAAAARVKSLPVRGKGDEYEQQGGEWKAVAAVTSGKSVFAPPALLPVPPVEPDMVNNPPHYTTGGIETIDFIEAKKLGYNLGNAVKYITRADYKGNRKQDLEKAVWYLNRELGGMQ